METIELNGITYRTGKLDAFQQFHAVRRLTPLLKALGQTLSSAPGGFIESLGGETTEQDEVLRDPDFTSKMWESFGPFAEAIAEVSDKDAEYVLKLCLRTCSRQTGMNGAGNWARITDNQGNLMFDDIDMIVMIRLTFEVIKDNLANFLKGLQPESGGVATTSELRPFQ